HQLLVDVEPPRGVRDEEIEPFSIRSSPGRLRQGDRILRLAVEVHRHADRSPENLELGDRGGSLEVKRGEEHPLTAVLPVPRELRRGCRLPRTLKSREAVAQLFEHGKRAQRGRVKPKAINAGDYHPGSDETTAMLGQSAARTGKNFRVGGSNSYKSIDTENGRPLILTRAEFPVASCPIRR